jgi:hypothetical protein
VKSKKSQTAAASGVGGDEGTQGRRYTAELASERSVGTIGVDAASIYWFHGTPGDASLMKLTPN